MRATLLLMVILALAAPRVIAQQKGLETSVRGTNAGVSLPAARLSSLVTQDTQLTTAEFAVGKKLRARGPLVSIFKARNVLDVPRRAFHFINPFAPAEGGGQLEQAADVNPRAWASTVSFHPGGSAFPDATTHESTMSLLTVGR